MTQVPRECMHPTTTVDGRCGQCGQSLVGQAPAVDKGDATWRGTRMISPQGQEWTTVEELQVVEAERDRYREALEQCMNTDDGYVYRLASHVLQGGSFDDWEERR